MRDAPCTLAHIKTQMRSIQQRGRYQWCEWHLTLPLADFQFGAGGSQTQVPHVLIISNWALSPNHQHLSISFHGQVGRITPQYWGMYPSARLSEATVTLDTKLFSGHKRARSHAQNKWQPAILKLRLSSKWNEMPSHKTCSLHFLNIDCNGRPLICSPAYTPTYLGNAHDGRLQWIDSKTDSPMHRHKLNALRQFIKDTHDWKDARGDSLKVDNNKTVEPA